MQQNRIKVLIVASKLRIGGAEKVAADIGFMPTETDLIYIILFLAMRSERMSLSLKQKTAR